jgi:AraC-like DNA-binding protein
MPVFIACAAAAKHTIAKEPSASASELVSRAEEIVHGALARPDPSDQRVVKAVEMIRSAAQAHERIKLHMIAEALNVDPTDLGRRIGAETGFDFTDWRTASILRPGVCRLLETDDGIKEIARGLLDFKHLSQFDVEFHRFFGLTPTEFRDIDRNRTR